MRPNATLDLCCLRAQRSEMRVVLFDDIEPQQNVTYLRKRILRPSIAPCRGTRDRIIREDEDVVAKVSAARKCGRIVARERHRPHHVEGGVDQRKESRRGERRGVREGWHGVTNEQRL